MKKILQINSVVNFGSTGRIAEEIGKVLVDNDWESYIAYSRGAGLSKSKLIKIGNDLDLKLHVIYSRLFDRTGFGLKKVTENLLEKISVINPDIIHLHNLHGYYLNIEVIFKYLKSINKPVFWTLHDCWSFTGHCAFFDSVNCSKWQTGCCKCPLRNEYPASWIIDNSLKNYNNKKKIFNGVSNLTLITPSHWLSNLLPFSFLKNYPTKVINNGIDTNIFTAVENDNLKIVINSQKKFLVLGVAHIWSKRKGLEDIIKLRTMLGDDYQFLLIGLNQKQINLLPAGITGIKRTESTKELAEYYSAADVFINPTYVDNFPTTNLEAIACGTPVITYNTGGSPEAIDKDTGVVVEKGDIDGLINAITKIKKNGKAFYSNKCRERALKHFNKNERYEDYLELYKNILK